MGHNELVTMTLVELKEAVDLYEPQNRSDEISREQLQRTIEQAITSTPRPWERVERNAAWVIDTFLDDAKYYDAETRAIGRKSTAHKECVELLNAIAAEHRERRERRAS